MKNVFPILVALLILLSGCTHSDTDEAFEAGYNSGYADGLAAAASMSALEPVATPESVVTPEPTAIPEFIKPLTYGDTFVFDGFEITFLAEYEFTKVKNQFSELDGMDVVAVPIVVTNKSGDTGMLNRYDVDVFLPDGTQPESCYTYFGREDIFSAGDIRDGATLNSKIHFLYGGDGAYYLELGRGETKLEVELPVIKPAND